MKKYILGILSFSLCFITALATTDLRAASNYCSASTCIIKNIPYLYQYDNPNGEGNANGGNTCQITAVAMTVNYFAGQSAGSIKTVKPTALYGVREFSKSPEGAAQVLKKRLGYGWWTRTGTREQLKGLIRSGRPAVLNTYFTYGGHVVLVVGFDDKGFIFHDPAGRWAETMGGGYPYGGTGSYLRYSYKSLAGEVIGVEKDMWFATGDIKPIKPGYGNSL